MTPQPRGPVGAPYVDTCVLLSLFLNDTGFPAAEQWLLELVSLPLRSGDALHLAIARREKLRLATADPALIRAAAIRGPDHQAIGNPSM